MIVENRKHCQYNAVNEQNGAKYTHNVYTAVPLTLSPSHCPTAYLNAARDGGACKEAYIMMAWHWRSSCGAHANRWLKVGASCQRQSAAQYHQEARARTYGQKGRSLPRVPSRG